MLNMYASWMPDAPQLNNTWGQLNAVLNWCLVDDSEELPITSVENTDQIGILKVNAPQSTINKFIKDMTISIGGSFYTELTSKPFLIVDIGTGFMKIARTNFPTEMITDTSETLTIKRVSAGMKRAFGGVEEKKTVFATGDDKFFLRIDDTNPTDGGRMNITSWDNNWYKMARVMISNGFNSLDEVNGQFAPFASNTNDQYNMNPSGDFTGWAKWYYNPVWDGNGYDNANYGRMNNAWSLFANDKVMYLIIYAGTGITHRSFSYMFGQFDCNDKTFPYNCLLNAHNRLCQYNASWSYLYPYASYNSPLLHRTYTSEWFKIMLRSYTGSYTGARVYEYSLDFGAQNSGSGGLAYPNPMDNMVSVNDALIHADDNLYGKYIGIKWISNNVINFKISNNTTFKYIGQDNQDVYYKYMLLNNEGTDRNQHTSVMFDLTK